jgi:farnesyl-diphosphate farnesyltransferase
MTDSSISDGLFQDQILPHVSRSFALTIPELPGVLRTQVTNAYLLCRIADTIEDESVLSAEATLGSLRRFVEVQPFLEDLLPQLSIRTSPGERDLVLNMARVIRVTAGLPERQRRAIQRCILVMCSGMHQFQQTASLRGPLSQAVALEHQIRQR